MSQRSKLEVELRPIFQNIDVLAEEGTTLLLQMIAEDDMEAAHNQLSLLLDEGLIEEQCGGVKLTEEGKKLHEQLMEVQKWGEGDTEEVENVTVLVGEDEPMSKELYSRQLQGVDIEFTLTHGEFLDALFESSVDVIVMERMFNKNTRELVDDIREMQPDQPIIVVTTLHPDSSILDWNIDEYLVKPVGSQELRRAISRTVKASHLPLKHRQLLFFLAKKMNLEKNRNPEQLDDDENYQQILEELQNLSEEF